METQPKKYKMLKTVQGARDGLNVETFQKGETYDLNPELAEQFYHQAAVEEVAAEAPQDEQKPAESPAQKPAESRSKKVTGPTETKVVAPGETKDGEDGVDLSTQRIEELVALARDHYGIEVDSTMDEAQVRELIENARGQASEGDETPDAPAKKTKKGKK